MLASSAGELGVAPGESKLSIPVEFDSAGVAAVFSSVEVCSLALSRDVG